MNNKLFKIIKDDSNLDDENELGKVVSALNVNKSKSAKLIPVQTGGRIDVVNDFKWTKTGRNSEGRKNTPAVELEEFQVVVPAFFSNLNVVQQLVMDTIAGAGGGIAALGELAGIPSSVTSLVQAPAKAVGKNMNILMDQARAAFSDENVSMPKYLKAYENLYGVKRTKFKYYFPYLENSYKSVASNWGGGDDSLQKILGDTASSFLTDTIFNKIAPGVGIDYSKSFRYGTEGPSHNISFFLDNTKDESYGGYETNFRLIYLLLYQNLPNRINKLTYVPPVIYRSKLPGVFSYRWSYLNNVNVDMIGVRRTKTINNFVDGRPSQVVIPEGYQVSFTIQSLVPETQNLYFDAFSNNVNVSVQT